MATKRVSAGSKVLIKIEGTLLPPRNEGEAKLLSIKKAVHVRIDDKKGGGTFMNVPVRFIELVEEKKTKDDAGQTNVLLTADDQELQSSRSKGGK